MNKFTTINKSHSLTILIPARNEEATLTKTLDSLIKEVTIPCKYIVISDQSTDHTVPNVKKYIKKNKNVTLLETPSTQNGFANALKLGIANTKTEYVLPVMADLCDDPKTINLMYQKIHEGYDIVAGSRYIPGGGKSGGPKLQGFFSRFVCLSLREITGIPTHDVSNSFKIYRKKTLNNLHVNANFGVEVSMHLTLQAYFRGAKITEVPTHWVGRTEGKSKFKLFKRFPRYLYIYLWAIKERVKQIMSSWMPRSEADRIP